VAQKSKKWEYVWKLGKKLEGVVDITSIDVDAIDKLLLGVFGGSKYLACWLFKCICYVQLVAKDKGCWCTRFSRIVATYKNTIVVFNLVGVGGLELIGCGTKMGAIQMYERGNTALCIDDFREHCDI
jgi:hypothetical protein